MLRTVLLICVLLASLEIGCAKKDNDGRGASFKEIDSAVIAANAAADSSGIVLASLENREANVIEDNALLKKMKSAPIVDSVTAIDISIENSEKISFKRFGFTATDTFCDIIISFTCPVAMPNSAVLAALQKNLIKQTFGEKLIGLKPIEVVERVGRDRAKEARSGDEYFCQEEYEYNDTAYFPFSGFLQYETYYSGYSCGAHPNHGISASIYNIADGKRVEPQDIFIKGWERNVAKLIIDKYLQDEGEKSLKDLNGGYAEEKDFIPVGDMLSFEDPNGITFKYGIYKIGPYAIGQPCILVSWDKLKPYLNEQSAIYPKLKFK
jgi:hypothetical protein